MRLFLCNFFFGIAGQRNGKYEYEWGCSVSELSGRHNQNVQPRYVGSALTTGRGMWAGDEKTEDCLHCY